MKDKTLKYLLGFFLLFNLWDAGSTVFVLNHDLAVELNPFMWWLYQFSPTALIFFKAFVGAGVVSLLWERRESRGTGILVGAIFGIYLLLFLYQTFMLFVLGLQ